MIMELNEFLEKFLPDYREKYKKSWEDYEQAVGISNLSYIEFDEDFYKAYFPEALQSYTDRICEKQRENCAKEANIEYIGWDQCDIEKDSILDSKQPKIEEL